MRERNREVPFPVFAQHDASLEGYLSPLVYKERPDFLDNDKLPPVFVSTKLDRYASWMADLTARDSVHSERASYIHIKMATGQFVFPTNPSIGTINRSDPDRSFNWFNNFPLIRVHSHPDSTSFSAHDLKRIIAKEEGSEENFAIGELLGSQRSNYLLLRTQQTPLVDVDRASEILDGLSQLTLQSQQQDYEAARDQVKSDDDTDKNLIMLFKNHAEREIFGADFARFYLTLSNSLLFANVFSLGFYQSDRNGVFKLVTQENLESAEARQKEEVYPKMIEIYQEVKEGKRKIVTTL